MFQNASQPQNTSQAQDERARDKRLSGILQDFVKGEIKNGLAVLVGTGILGFITIAILKYLFDQSTTPLPFDFISLLLGVIIWILVIIALVLMRIAYLLAMILFER